MHRAECFCVEEPLEDLRTALAQRIVQALLRSRAETVQRNTKSRNSNLLQYIFVLLASNFILSLLRATSRAARELAQSPLLGSSGRITANSEVDRVPVAGVVQRVLLAEVGSPIV